MRRKKMIRKISDHTGIILITLTMVIVKLIRSTCNSWRLDWSIPRDKEAAEKKVRFRVLKWDYTKWLKIHERQENYVSFCCRKKLIYSVQVCCGKMWSKLTQFVYNWTDLLWGTFPSLGKSWWAGTSCCLLPAVWDADYTEVLCILLQVLLHHMKCLGGFEWTRFYDSSNRNRTNYICLMAGPTLR